MELSDKHLFYGQDSTIKASVMESCMGGCGMASARNHPVSHDCWAGRHMMQADRMQHLSGSSP
jgi:hypothetical protein